MSIAPDQFRQVRYERPADGIARIVLARPEKRNAQGNRMTYELNAAFDAAAQDETVRVILLAADGLHFSAGHDFSETFDESFERVSSWGASSTDGADALFGDEMEVFFEMCERWRNLSKPTIALVQGKCIAGGLMLAWACDLILAAEDASFKDPTIDMGIMGVETFAHPFELGTRRAKEFLFTADWLSADRAMAFGMINRVVPASRLAAEGLSLAAVIAAKPPFAVRAAKIAVNQAQDAMGRWQTLRHAFALHHLTHANNRIKFDAQIDPAYARTAAGDHIKGLEGKIRDFGPERAG
ncbi:enoyl-CoA hydratase [Sphingopyxis sp. OAS728]|uniref:enoyl-CoA hydratase n=1 Tax=Sphingopyxis sp. OAS728 TaxID=2663823 RepID=UPI00178BD77B|nr:enoyl-CoA hydratase [Sphingopyxis sp. OAS728]MBE1527989.1 enoyl-CoA hydratase [Sphingopyxis sp. OAS728]